MPFYDLRCNKCKKEFNTMASMSDRSENRITCPECGSNSLEAVFKSVFFNVKGTNQNACPNSHICGSGCSHAHNRQN